VLFVTNDRFSPNVENAVHAFCHAVPNTWHQMGVILSATDSLNWLARRLKKAPGELTAALGARRWAVRCVFPAVSRRRADAPQRRRDPGRIRRDFP
jgi:sugar (pentulose or hexulose) kinase